MGAKPKKAKRMSEAEKRERAKFRTKMRAEGVIPPKKKPLDREKFIREARDEFKNWDGSLWIHLYMLKAIGWTMSAVKPTLEDVGVAKLLKVACEIARFETELTQAGRKEYTDDELYERLKPILKA